MWGIGLRAKFFIVSFMVLMFSTLSVTGILLAYFRTEKINFLDEQIRETATSIIESKLSELKNYDDDEAEDLISEELGPQRIGKFFVVRNSSGDILFETQNLPLLGIDIPLSPKWVTIKTDDHYIRVLNLNPSKYKSRLLQVGAIVDKNFLSLVHMSDRAYLLVTGIFVITLILTWILSYVLFSPIGHLAQYLNKITERLAAGQEIDVYKERTKFLLSSQNASDEFARLEKAIEEMSSRLNQGRRFMKSWTWQMAHELKTPLAILYRDLEVLFERYQVGQIDRDESLIQIRKISKTITSFLDWSELTQQQRVGDLFVLDLAKALRSEIDSLNRIYEGRVQFNVHRDFKIMMNPLHIEQLARNLIENSLKYSGDIVIVELKENKIIVSDKGDGIPAHVLSSLGQPFNKGPTSGARGLGLGLAWVSSICKVYNLEMDISDHGGCVVVIDLHRVGVDELQE